MYCYQRVFSLPVVLCLSVCLSVCLFVSLPVGLCLSVCLSVCFSACWLMSVCLSLCPLAYLKTMQLETAHFAYGAASWRTRRNLMCRNWFWLIRSIKCKHDVNLRPEVHNVMHCRQRTTEPRLQLTCTKIRRNLFMWFLATGYTSPRRIPVAFL